MPKRPRLDVPKAPVARKRPVVAPQWDGVFEKWAHGYVRKNLWRVRHVLGDHDDAMQECGLIFARCRVAFYKRGGTHAQFMRLFQTAVNNDWADYSTKDTRYRFMELDCTEKTDYNLGPLSVLLSEASSDLQRVLSFLFDAPADVLDMLCAEPVKKRGQLVDEQSLFVQRLRRMAGVRGNVDINGELQDLLGG